jgi:hypothetical protein
MEARLQSYEAMQAPSSRQQKERKLQERERRERGLHDEAPLRTSSRSFSPQQEQQKRFRQDNSSDVALLHRKESENAVHALFSTFTTGSGRSEAGGGGGDDPEKTEPSSHQAEEAVDKVSVLSLLSWKREERKERLASPSRAAPWVPRFGEREQQQQQQRQQQQRQQQQQQRQQQVQMKQDNQKAAILRIASGGSSGGPEPTPAPPSPPLKPNEARRAKARQQLTAVLAAADATVEGCNFNETPTVTAMQLEEAVLEAYSTTNVPYLNRIRTLVYNLGQNKQLAGEAVVGEKTPRELAAMTIDQLAPHHIVEERQRMEQLALRQVVLPLEEAALHSSAAAAELARERAAQMGSQGMDCSQKSEGPLSPVPRADNAETDLDALRDVIAATETVVRAGVAKLAMPAFDYQSAGLGSAVPQRPPPRPTMVSRTATAKALNPPLPPPVQQHSPFWKGRLDLYTARSALLDFPLDPPIGSLPPRLQAVDLADPSAKINMEEALMVSAARPLDDALSELKLLYQGKGGGRPCGSSNSARPHSLCSVEDAESRPWVQSFLLKREDGIAISPPVLAPSGGPAALWTRLVNGAVCGADVEGECWTRGAPGSTWELFLLVGRAYSFFPYF